MDGGRQFMDDGGWRMMNGGECQSLAEYLAVNKTMKCVPWKPWPLHSVNCLFK